MLTYRCSSCGNPTREKPTLCQKCGSSVFEKITLSGTSELSSTDSIPAHVNLKKQGVWLFLSIGSLESTIGFFVLIGYAGQSSTTYGGMLSFFAFLFVNIIWFILFYKASSLTTDFFDKKIFRWLLILTLLYLLFICLVPFLIGIGIYTNLFSLIFHCINAGILFTGLLLLVSAMQVNKNGLDQIKRFSLMAALVLGVLTIGMLLGLVGLRYSAVVPRTTAEWRKYEYSSNPFERQTSIQFFVKSSNTTELHHLLFDSDSEVADVAYDAIWKLHKDESIPVLIEFLNSKEKGAYSLAVDYLNSGNSELETAAEAWAQEHGYEITSQPSNETKRHW